MAKHFPRLILGPIPDDFDHEIDRIVWLGSVIGKEHLLPSHYDTDLKIRVATIQQKSEGIFALRQLIDNVFLPELSTYLNEMHGVHYSLGFWRILLDHYLIRQLIIYWEHFKNLEFILKNNRDHFLVEISSFINLSNIPDPYCMFYSVNQDTHFHQWVLSLFLQQYPQQYLKIIDNQILFQPRIINPNDKASIPYTKVRDRCDNTLIRGMTHRQSYYLSKLLTIKPVCDANNSSLNNLHKESKQNKFPKQFVKVARKIIYETLPNCYTKNFYYFNQKALETGTYVKGKCSIMGPITHHDEYLKFYTAHAYEKGERLLMCQHGGCYGIDAWHYDYVKVEYTDMFVSWGWCRDNYTLPLPSPMLSQFRNRHKRTTNRLIFIGNGTVMPDALFLNYLSEKVIFLNTLSKEIQKNTVYRPYINSNQSLSFKDKEYVHYHCPEIELFPGSKDGSNELEQEQLKCKLLVTDYNSTTFLIALAANIPFVCYFSPAVHDYSPSFQPYYERLKTVGIVFDTPKEAALHINNIWDNTDSWWFAKETQLAKEYVANEYSLTDRLWFWKWVKALWLFNQK